MAEFKQMTLSACAQHDHNNKVREKLTGWGKVCKDRQERGVSRRLKILRKKGKAV